VTWFAENQRQIKLKLDPQQPLRDVVLFTASPTGGVEGIRLSADVKGDGGVSVDVGCDGVIDGVLHSSATGGATQLDSSSCGWLQAVAKGLQSAAWRDGSRWRQCPVRLTAAAPTEMILGNLQVTVSEE
jgi:hypothetical protein